MGRARRIEAALVLTDAGPVSGASVEVADGVIRAIDPVDHPVPSRILGPGFVDLQVNGVGAVDCWTADGAEWEALDDALLAQGVTAWCPTLVSAPLADYEAAFERIAAARTRARIVGVHLEGPFLGGRPGAHRRDALVDIDHGWLADLPDLVRLVTLAPERAGAPEAIESLVTRGITVSLGHSAPTREQLSAAVEAGATLVTHLFNGMTPFHHREPGLAGRALADDRLTAMLIADLVHVAPEAVTAAVRAKGRDRWLAVTDAVAWQSPDLVAAGVECSDGAPRLPDGTLAGSALTMDGAVANLVNRCGVPVVDAVRAASTTPARALGLVDHGRLAVGARADLVALDRETLRCEATWIAGELVHG